MKTAVKLIVFSSFFLVAVFGFAILMSGSAHCLVSLMEGGVCPEGLFGFASFHIGFFKNISSVVSGNLGLLAAFLILGFLAFVVLVSPQELFLSPKKFAAKSFREPAVLVKKFRTWLSLLETSPTLFSSR